jgi:hypothetical protein
MFPRDMVCLRNINVDTLHKGDIDDIVIVIVIVIIIIIIIIIMKVFSCKVTYTFYLSTSYSKSGCKQ